MVVVTRGEHVEVVAVTGGEQVAVVAVVGEQVAAVVVTGGEYGEVVETGGEQGEEVVVDNLKLALVRVCSVPSVQPDSPGQHVAYLSACYHETFQSNEMKIVYATNPSRIITPKNVQRNIITDEHRCVSTWTNIL